MTTAREPWTTLHAGEGALIRDANGETIARFDDWRNADRCIELFDEILGRQAALTDEIDKQCGIINSLEEDVAKLENENKKLRNKL